MSDWALLFMALASITLGIFSFTKGTYPRLVEAHRSFDHYRVEYDGYTLPWFLCCLYWVGAEGLAPEWTRKRPGRIDADR